MTNLDKVIKRGFDVLGAAIGLLTTGWFIVITWLLATLDTRQNGFFMQARVGKDGKLFNVIKIRTMRSMEGIQTNVTCATDPRITRLGSFLRQWKIDELPQLWNVLIGRMSFVGPRPDVPGFADKLTEEDRIILSIRPGITGPATLKYRDEEDLLARQTDPDCYNDEVIWPDKVRLNLEYVRQYSFWKDLGYIWQTIKGNRG
jgi:lipopolysaccharide/colanic/teichoic acid biosynthesis glycosyltransferase